MTPVISVAVDPRAPARSIESAVEMLNGEKMRLPGLGASCWYVAVANWLRPVAGGFAASAPATQTGSTRTERFIAFRSEYASAGRILSAGPIAGRASCGQRT